MHSPLGTRTAVLPTATDTLMSDGGDFDPHAVNTAWGPDQAAVQQAAALTGTFDARTRIVSFDGQLSFDAFQMENGAVPVALGFEYRDDKFEQDYDEQQNANNVAGSSGGADVTGARVAVRSVVVHGLGCRTIQAREVHVHRRHGPVRVARQHR